MADTSDQAASQDQAYFDKMKQQILDALETVIDPELGVDLINLGFDLWG
ncbi:MIP18 family protein yitW [Lacticaseibacillus paracasei subsp. paracasei Lpp126]|uniref:MIP18 family protein yitW n=1 Tax=Lacticaseibacillus paracasei subsp. paracasei Lpp126 TaxID=1256206 RepID=S2SHV0_LACPA|nr:MIP18 family protein yitW [Lacticaseibacillus paracasei subsp. paracasei Lpp126]